MKAISPPSASHPRSLATSRVAVIDMPFLLHRPPLCPGVAAKTSQGPRSNSPALREKPILAADNRLALAENIVKMNGMSAFDPSRRTAEFCLVGSGIGRGICAAIGSRNRVLLDNHIVSDN